MSESKNISNKITSILFLKFLPSDKKQCSAKMRGGHDSRHGLLSSSF